MFEEEVKRELGEEYELEKSKQSQYLQGKEIFQISDEIDENEKDKDENKKMSLEIEEQTPEKSIKKWAGILGILFAIGQAISMSVQAYFVRSMIKYGYSPLAQLIIRSYVYLLISLTGMKIKKISILNLSSPEFKFVKIRVFAVLLSNIFLVFSLKYTPAVSLVTILARTSSIFVLIFSRFLIKNEFQKAYIFPIIFSFVGVLFVIQPGFIFGTGDDVTSSSNFTIVLVLALGAATTDGFTAVYLRRERDNIKNVSIFGINFSYGILCLIVSTLGSLLILREEIFYSYEGLALLCLCHSLNFVAWTCNYFAMKYQNASIISIVLYFQIVIVYVTDLSFYGMDFEIFNFLGACMIIVSSIAITIYSLKKKK